MMDEYRKEWALRFLREAKAELEAARNIPYMAPRFVLEAVKKAQSAIYYILGEPAFIENLVKEEREKKQAVNDPVLNCLIGVEETVQRLMRQEVLDGERALERAQGLVQLASEIVETLIGEKLED